MTNRSLSGAVFMFALLIGCGAAEDTPPSSPGNSGGRVGAGGKASGGTTSAGGTTSSVTSGGTAVVGGGGTSTSSSSAGIGLYSSVFEAGGTSAGGTSGAPPVVCDDSEPGTCDWTRVEGCCKQWACNRANGEDVFNPRPITACEALVTCVRANPGCSTASDPLCFQDEKPTAPCLDEGYLASHEDPDGPFAWTEHLVRCVCGYPQEPASSEAE
ncbi:MAG TPA: hypothetical protein VFQ61_19925 [Polyangiaceae bacterium]|nr:hypothetical protein [Polyangiaceae bacterium]